MYILVMFIVFKTGEHPMRHDRRDGKHRSQRNQRRRCSVRRAVERLESRVLPGGVLDVLATAAFTSSFDPLPEQPWSAEETRKDLCTDASRDSTGRVPRSGTILLAHRALPEKGIAESGLVESRLVKNELVESGLVIPQRDGMHQGTLDHFSLERQFAWTPSAFGHAAPPTFPIVAGGLRATSLVDDHFAAGQDAFFTHTQFVEPPEVNIKPHGQLEPRRVQPLGAPVSKLGSDVGAGSGQGFSMTGAESPSGDARASSAASGSPYRTYLAEGEGDAMTGGETGGGYGDGSVSGTGQKVTIGEGGAYTITSMVCHNLPTEPAPNVFYRDPGSQVDNFDQNYRAPVHFMDDANDEGVIIGTPGTDEKGSFPLPIGLPFVDDSFTAWLEITGYRRWEEYHNVFTRANGNPTEPYEHMHEVTTSLSYATTTTRGASLEVSREVSATAEVQVVNIASKLGAGVTLSNAFSATTTEERTTTKVEKVSASPCQTVGVYQKFEIAEVTMKFVHYQDRSGLGWLRTPSYFNHIVNATPSTVTIVSVIAVDKLTSRARSGNVTVESYPSPR